MMYSNRRNSQCNCPSCRNSYQNRYPSQNEPTPIQNVPPKLPPKSDDYGPEPFVLDIQQATIDNTYYRSTLWTGQHLQLTLMCINVNDDIGLEMHPHVDQFLYLEQGEGIVMMGERKDQLCYQQNVCAGSAILIPSNTWHNVVNTGCTPLKLFAIYGPPNHPHGTLHRTKKEAEYYGD